MIPDHDDLRRPASGLPAGPRPIRRVEPPESPWPAVLAKQENGLCHLVDVRALADWSGWDAPPDRHLLAPTDIVRRIDGHDVVVPVCAQTLDDFLARRRAAGVPLTPGEGVTLAVSVLRGEAEHHRRRGGRRSPDGRWWLTDTARPVLVEGARCPASGEGALRDGSAEAGEHTEAPSAASVFEDVGTAAPVVAQVMGRAAELLARARFSPREIADLEGDLFSLAPPEPLGTAILAPIRTAHASAAQRAPHAASAPAVPARTRSRGVLSAVLDAGPAALRARVADALRRRLPGGGSRERPRRGRAAIVAGAIGAVVLGVGLMWPASPHDPAAAEQAPPAPSESGGRRSPGADSAGRSSASPPGRPSSGPAPSSSVTPPASAPAPTDLVATTASLLERRAACGADQTCVAALQEDGSRSFPAGVATGTRAPRLVLLDDFGGAAVLRAEDAAGRGRPQLVVIVRGQEEWLLRDVHDVAEQPSGG